MDPLRICHDRQLSLSGKIKYTVNGKKTSSGTFSRGDRVKLELHLPRLLGVSLASLIISCDDDGIRHTVDGVWQETYCGNDIYEFDLTALELNAGLYFFSAEIDSIFGKLYTISTLDDVKFTESMPKEGFQITVSDFKYSYNPDFLGGIIYHIFVDRFNSSRKCGVKDGAILVKDWNSIPEFPSYPGAPMKNNTFYGGDLEGIRRKLPYLSSLGVTMLYLSPIFEAKSNHKYDTADYMKVDPMFGGDRELKALIKKAKKLGISIILDGVFNHTGDDSIYFNRYNSYQSLGAYQSKDSVYYPWYDFKSHPDSYTAWWGIEILPRINPDEPSCREFFTGKGGVVEKYAKMGIDGFRLDVVDELSDGFVSEIKGVLDRNNPGSILYGEVWEDPSNKIAYGKRKRYYQGSELDGAMNYPLRRGIIDYLKSERTDTLKYALTTVMNNAPERIRHVMMNILGTHDTERIITLLAGESSYGKTNDYLSTLKMSEEEMDNGVRLLKTAYTILATLPGLPTIFYGDEAGLEGYGDPLNRMPYPWGKENEELLKHYRMIGDLRRTHEVYKDGEFKLHHLDDDILAFSRSKSGVKYVTLVNNSLNPIRLFNNVKYKVILGENDVIPAKSAIVIKTNSSRIQLIKI